MLLIAKKFDAKNKFGVLGKIRDIFKSRGAQILKSPEWNAKIAAEEISASEMSLKNNSILTFKFIDCKKCWEFPENIFLIFTFFQTPFLNWVNYCLTTSKRTKIVLKEASIRPVPYVGLEIPTRRNLDETEMTKAVLEVKSVDTEGTTDLLMIWISRSIGLRFI